MRGSTRARRPSKAKECAGVCAPRAERSFHDPIRQLLTSISSVRPGFWLRITTSIDSERASVALSQSFGLTLSPLLWIQNRARGEPRARKCMQPTHENEHGKWTQQPELLHSESGVCVRDVCVCVCMYVAGGGTDGPALGREGWGVGAEVRQQPSPTAI